MNQAQKKIKLLPSKSSKNVARPGVTPQAQPPSPETTSTLEGSIREAAEITAFWKEELDSLEGKHFGSVAEAIDFLVDKVLDRLHISGPERAQTRDYMVVLFDTDPDLQEQLSELVQVK